jgi:hypothetical protein
MENDQKNIIKPMLNGRDHFPISSNWSDSPMNRFSGNIYKDDIPPLFRRSFRLFCVHINPNISIYTILSGISMLHAECRMIISPPAHGSVDSWLSPNLTQDVVRQNSVVRLGVIDLINGNIDSGHTAS